MTKPLWFFGDAVQDITVEIDLDRLSREQGNLRQLIRFVEQGLEVREGLWLRTQIGVHSFAVEISLKGNAPSKDGFYLLKPGSKHNLSGEIHYNGECGDNTSVFVPCETVSWGGGGVNCVTFLRAVAPNDKIVPIRYTDIAMSQSLPELLLSVERLRAGLGDVKRERNAKIPVSALLRDLYRTNPSLAEAMTSQVAKMATEYAPDRSLEVYLHSLPMVSPFLYRPKKPLFRRNLVISRIRTAARDITDKIIFRGSSEVQSDANEVTKLLEACADEAGAIVLNSLKSEAMFHAAYSLYKAQSKREDIVGIMAMTHGMQRFKEWLVKERGEGSFPPMILVFNAEEAFDFARQFDRTLEPFVAAPDDFPNVKQFGKLGAVLAKQFEQGRVPRIYVTLGAKGSLGIDGMGPVVYVGSFSKPGSTTYDTNACGDAFCAMISLLEWAKRNGYSNIAEVEYGKDNLASAKEMIYFMTVASAAAYSKATHRRGKVYATDVKDLLDNVPLPNEILPNVWDLRDRQRPDCVEEDDRLIRAPRANLMRVKPALQKLMSSDGSGY